MTWSEQLQEEDRPLFDATSTPKKPPTKTKKQHLESIAAAAAPWLENKDLSPSREKWPKDPNQTNRHHKTTKLSQIENTHQTVARDGQVKPFFVGFPELGLDAELTVFSTLAFLYLARNDHLFLFRNQSEIRQLVLGLFLGKHHGGKSFRVADLVSSQIPEMGKNHRINLERLVNSFFAMARQDHHATQPPLPLPESSVSYAHPDATRENLLNYWSEQMNNTAETATRLYLEVDFSARLDHTTIRHPVDVFYTAGDPKKPDKALLIEIENSEPGHFDRPERQAAALFSFLLARNLRVRDGIPDERVNLIGRGRANGQVPTFAEYWSLKGQEPTRISFTPEETKLALPLLYNVR